MRDFSELMIEMEIHVNETIMKRGLTYYRENRIMDADIFPTHVHGIVNGKGDDYDTIVYLDQFENSICTCPFNGYCKHIAALVFYVQDHNEFMVEETNSFPAEIRGFSKDDLVQMIQTLGERNSFIRQAVLDYIRKEKP
ncbi:SWIM zinc finger family protein [Bacillus sp. NTK074B]|uniref:SWIM zinc finger family protein n=1 Tax=Bacillus sp. NTK074B TaxID=2802174 RepID=UPI001A8DC743|nr:SWIM zinc finger family protein [Bacillus sp. NTK074B]